MPFGRNVAGFAERRIVKPVPEIAYASIGPSDYLVALMARSPLGLTPVHARLATKAMSKRVAKHTPGADIFQFVQGLGHAGLRHGMIKYAICECRTLHYKEFETDLEVYNGFPFEPALHPTRDIAEEEYEQIDRIVVYSEVAANSFVRRGVSRSKIHVAPLFIAAPNVVKPILGKERDPYHVLFVGRGDAFKGLDVAVGAVEQLGSPFRLSVAGSASNRVRNWLSGRDAVYYAGVVDRASLDRLYGEASIFVAPSMESFGLAALEAAGAGMLVLCRETTGIHEHLSSSATTVVVGRKIDDWASAIECLATDDLSTVLAKRECNQRAARELDLTESVSSLELLYTEIPL